MVFQNRNKGTWDGIEKAAMMGTNFVAHILVGLAVGYFFDFKWFPSLKPWGLFFWLIMGIVAGFRSMYLDAMKIGKSQEMDAAKQTGSGAEAGAAGKADAGDRDA